MKIYMARHGQSEGNIKNIFYGRTDFPLTAKGEEEAINLGKELALYEIARCYSSTLKRARHTAELALQNYEMPLSLHDELVEQDMGEWECLEFTEVVEDLRREGARLVRAWPEVEIPGGESFEDVKNRVKPLLDKIIEENEDVLIVAHYGSLTAICALLLGMDNATAGALNFKHERLSCIEYENGLGRLNFLNR